MSKLASDLGLSYLIQPTADHDGEGDYQADIIPSGVVTLVFSSLKLSADNEVFLAQRLDAAVTCQNLSLDVCDKTYTTYSNFHAEFVFLKSLPD